MIQALILLTAMVLAGAILLIGPSSGAVGTEVAALCAIILVGATLFALFVFMSNMDKRRLMRLERSLTRLLKQVDRLESSVSMAREGPEDLAQSEDMIREMRVLQTLLGQILGQGGSRTEAKKTGVEVNDLLQGLSISSAARQAVKKKESRTVQEIMHEALTENRIDLYLQPTVALPSRRTVHYECFSRVRDDADNVIYPSEYMPLAERSGVTGTLDNLLLFRCIQLVRKLGERKRDVRFFYNLSLASIEDDEFFSQFADYMNGNPRLADRLVFEVPQRAFTDLGIPAQRKLEEMGRRGFSFSLDHIEEGRLDFDLFAGFNVNFVKIDAERFLDGGLDIHPADIQELMKRQNISLIVSKVETEAQVLELLDHDVGLAQGYLFGEPRPSREEPAVD